MMVFYKSLKCSITVFFLFICIFTNAQFTSNTKQTFNSSNAFINNIGQYGTTYKGHETMGSILFGYEGNNRPILFTKKGVIFLHRKLNGLSPVEKEKLERKGVKEEEIEQKMTATDKVITMEWLGANSNVEILQEEKTYEYHTYGLLTNKAYGYKQITYKNLYNGIDLIYSFKNNDKIGFEYSLKVAAGSDISQIKMQYGGDLKQLKITKQGNLIIDSDIEGIEQTAPLSFYDNTQTGIQNNKSDKSNQSSAELNTGYSLTKNQVSFTFPRGYDSTKELTIDPFVSSTSNLLGFNAGKAKDIDFDYAGNVYVTGGGSGNGTNSLAKYNSNGVLQWTFNGIIPGVWQFGQAYGGMAVDKSTGKIYLGQGGVLILGFRVIRLDTNGLYDNYITTANPNFEENWKLFWNCNNGSIQILAGGGGTNSNLDFGIINPQNPSVTALNITGSPGAYQDLVDFLVDPLTNNMYSIYAAGLGLNVAHNRIYCHATPYSSTSISWSTPTGFDALSELFNRPYLASATVTGVGQDNSANILAINPTYLFYFDGRNLKAFNKSTGTTVGTALQLDGVFSEKYTGGIYADACNNVYAGAANGIIKVYNFNGSNFDDSPTDIIIPGYSTKSVYDLAYNEELNLLYASGDGFVTAFDISSNCVGFGGGFTLNVLSSCSTATATLLPTPPTGAVTTYSLFIGSTLVTSNSTGIFTGLTSLTNYTIKVTISQSCGAVRLNKNFVGTTVSATPLVNTPILYCKNAASTALTASGTNLLWYTTAIGGIGSTTAPTPSTTTGGNTTYYVTQNPIGGCGESLRAAIVVTVNVVPPPSVISPLYLCQNSGATQLTATGSNLKWYDNPVGGTWSGIAMANTNIVGNRNYYVSQTDTAGGSYCESDRSVISVETIASLPPPSGNSSVSYCQGATATPLIATGTNLIWYPTNTGGVGSSTAPTPNTSTVGVTFYYVGQAANGAIRCESQRAIISVNVQAIPIAPTVTSPVFYCQGQAASPLIATGSFLSWYSVPVGGSPSFGVPTPNTSTIGNTIYYVSQSTSGGCEGPRAAITVQVSSSLPAPTVVSPINYCLGSTATALTATGTNLKWYTSATGGTSSAIAPIPNTTVVGSTTFYVSQSTASGTCESPRSALTVQVTTIAAAPTVIPLVNYCQGAAATALNASGTNLRWYTVASGGVGSTIAPIPSTTAFGSTIYYVSQNASNASSCESPRAAITVNVIAPASAPLVTNISYCVGALSTALTATGTNLLWYTTATGGTGSAIAPIPSTSTIGTTIYYVSQSTTGNNCGESPRSALTVQVTTALAAPSVSNTITYCQGATASALTATGTNLLWYSSATGGTGSNTAPVPTTTVVGTTIYYVSQSTNSTGSCESPRAAITVIVNAATVAPNVTNIVNYCQGSTPLALSATGTNLLWYTTATGGVGSTIAPIPSTVFVGSTTYYVSQTVGTCESPRSSIIVTVNAGPSITTQPQDITACTTSATFSVTAIGTNLTYQWFLSINGGTSYNAIAGATGTTYTINGLTPAQINNKYRVIVSSGACNSAISNGVIVKVGINPIVLLTATPTVNFNPYTNGGLNVSITPSGNYTYQWKRNNIVLSNTGTTITKANGLLFDFGNYIVTATDNVTGCVGSSNTVTVTDIEGTRGELFVYPNPSNGILNISFYSSTTAAQNYSVNVYDAKGARLITKGITLTGIYGFAIVNISSFAKGDYIITLRDATGKKLASKKVIKF